MASWILKGYCEGFNSFTTIVWLEQCMFKGYRLFEGREYLNLHLTDERPSPGALGTRPRLFHLNLCTPGNWGCPGRERLRAGGEGGDRGWDGGWHHQLNEYEFEQTPGDSEGQGSLVCCSRRSQKELGVTSQLNNDSNKKWQGSIA